jgi:ATP-binding cassette subfamily B protein
MLAIFTLTSFVADVFSESVPSALHNVAIEWVIVDVAGIHVNYTMLLLVLVTLLLLVIIRMISDKLLARINYLSSANVKKVLRDKIYDKLLRLGPSYKESVSTAEVVQLSTEGVEQLGRLPWQGKDINLALSDCHQRGVGFCAAAKEQNQR